MQDNITRARTRCDGELQGWSEVARCVYDSVMLKMFKICKRAVEIADERGGYASDVGALDIQRACVVAGGGVIDFGVDVPGECLSRI